MNKLRKTLLMNSVSCILFGLIFLIFPVHTNEFIGNNMSWLTRVIGVILLFNGFHLIYASKRKSAICPEILYFVLGDFLWVLGTFVLIAMGIIITSTQGIVVSLIIATVVGTFGYLQIIGYKQVCQNA